MGKGNQELSYLIRAPWKGRR